MRMNDDDDDDDDDDDMMIMMKPYIMTMLSFSFLIQVSSCNSIYPDRSGGQPYSYKGPGSQASSSSSSSSSSHHHADYHRRWCKGEEEEETYARSTVFLDGWSHDTVKV